MGEKELLSVCFTGTCPSHTRAELIEMVEGKYEVKDSVNKGLDILVCADPNAGSSKLQKAEKNGVKIVSYEEFLEMIENGDDDEDTIKISDFFQKIKNQKIDESKVEQVLEVYGGKLSEEAQRIVSICGDDSLEFKDCKFRLLSLDEILNAEDVFDVFFLEYSLIPFVDCGDGNLIVYDIDNSYWTMYRICTQCDFGYELDSFEELFTCWMNGEMKDEDDEAEDDDESDEVVVDWEEYRIKQAEMGDPVVQYNLGCSYRDGSDGMPQNYFKAIEWYTKSAEQGYSIAQYMLGLLYSDGRVPVNYEKAIEWYTKAAEQGNADAQCNLGNCYEDGESVEKDLKKAVELYTKAADQGNAQAQCNLGNYYYNGVEEDHEKAVEWWTKAAQQGHGAAMFNLGVCYYYGQGVKQNYEKTVEWWTKAAEKGDANAMCLVGEFFEEGKGVEQNYQTAAMWYQRAIDGGNDDARQKLKELQKMIEAKKEEKGETEKKEKTSSANDGMAWGR